MVQWEYKVIKFRSFYDKNDENEQQKILNTMGAKGWELVAVTDGGEWSGVRAYLKKEEV